MTILEISNKQLLPIPRFYTSFQNFPIKVVSSIAQIKENFARRCDKRGFPIYAQAKYYMVQAFALPGRVKINKLRSDNTERNQFSF